MCDKLPFKISPVEDDSLLEGWFKEKDHVVQVGEKKWLILGTIRKFGPDYYNFSIKSDDVWIMGFPRSGPLHLRQDQITTLKTYLNKLRLLQNHYLERTSFGSNHRIVSCFVWCIYGTTITQEIVWLIENNLDFERTKSVPFFERVVTLEHIMLANVEQKIDSIAYLLPKIENIWENLKTTNDRRFIKTHLPISMLNPNFLEVGPKTVYMLRNPKDVIVSNYQIYKDFQIVDESTLDFPKFWKMFKNDLVLWAPYFEHIKEIWQLQHKKNFLLVQYEDLLINPEKKIEEIANFLGKKLTKEEIKAISNYCTKDFDKKSLLKGKDDKFIKTPQKWKNYFVGDLENEVNEWIENNLKKTGIHLKYI